MIIVVVVPTVVYCKICAIYLYNCFFKVVFTSGVTDISHLLSHHVYHVHSLTWFIQAHTHTHTYTHINIYKINGYNKLEIMKNYKLLVCIYKCVYKNIICNLFIFVVISVEINITYCIL